MKITRKLLLTTGLAIVTVAMLGLLASDVPVKIRLAALVFANDDAPVEVLGQPPVGMELPWTPPGGGEEEEEFDDVEPLFDEIKEGLRNLTEILESWRQSLEEIGLPVSHEELEEMATDTFWTKVNEIMEEWKEDYGIPQLPQLPSVELLSEMPTLPDGSNAHIWEFGDYQAGVDFSGDHSGIAGSMIILFNDSDSSTQLGIKIAAGYDFTNSLGNLDVLNNLGKMSFGDLLEGSYSFGIGLIIKR